MMTEYRDMGSLEKWGRGIVATLFIFLVAFPIITLCFIVDIINDGIRKFKKRGTHET